MCKPSDGNDSRSEHRGKTERDQGHARAEDIADEGHDVGNDDQWSQDKRKSNEHQHRANEPQDQVSILFSSFAALNIWAADATPGVAISNWSPALA